MKNLIFFLAFSIFVISCQKEMNTSDELTYLEQVKINVKDSLASNDFSSLDFSRTIRTEIDEQYLLRVSQKGKPLANDFVLLETDKRGAILRGLIIHMERTPLLNEDPSKYNGVISASSLRRNTAINSKIVNGFITAFPSSTNQRSLVVPRPKNELPDVVVTCYITSRGISFSDWISLQSLFGGISGIYDNLDGTSTGGDYGGGGGSSGSSGPVAGGGGGSIEIDYEPDDIPAIDITKYLKCFASIPDNGAECSIEILADIPVDKDPQMFFNYSNGSPGHVFLQIKKSNGGKSVSQNIGFYPNQGWKTLLNPTPINSKCVDNQGHEYNAGLKRNMTPTQLKGLLANMEYAAKNKQYDIDDYNCTDFALEIFNSISGNKTLIIPKYNIPLGTSPANTPQGLYQKLKSMKETGVESNNITMPAAKGWVGNSSGPCN